MTKSPNTHDSTSAQSPHVSLTPRLFMQGVWGLLRAGAAWFGRCLSRPKTSPNLPLPPKNTSPVSTTDASLKDASTNPPIVAINPIPLASPQPTPPTPTLPPLPYTPANNPHSGGAANDVIIQSRRAICNTCPLVTKLGGWGVGGTGKPNPAQTTTPIPPTASPAIQLSAMSRCLACHCFIYPKTLLNNEKCPQGKW